MEPHVKTRFPPEPNGYIHLGHLKSICKSFEFAKQNNGTCILRFDDTNPGVEKEEYIENIIDDVNWLGYSNYEKITYTSDYFDLLYNFAIELIEKDLAYVDFTPKEEFRELRKNGVDSKYRNHTVDQNLEFFEKMRSGYYKEGECVLKLKIDMNHPNACMRDPTAYRIIFLPHHRTGDKWCIYPTYDYSHSIIDSTEDITHSFCTNEFYIRRDIYYWILEKLNLRKPEEIEYSKLDITGIVLSKRKIIEDIKNNKFVGFNDPRLYTIKGLRNRGFDNKCLIEFCKILSYNNTNAILEMAYFENFVRKHYDETCERGFAVRNPITVELVNFDSVLALDNINPKIAQLNVTKTIYIENNDFLVNHDNKYKRFSPKNKYIRLKYLGIIEYLNNNDTKIIAKFYSEDDAKKNNIKPSGTIHWISEDNIKQKIRYIDDENKICEIESLIEKRLIQNADNIYQLERVGYWNPKVNFMIINLLSKF